MSYIPRTLTPHLRDAFAQTPIVAVLGPRQSGKSTLVRHVFSELPYSNLERPDVRAFATEDPIAYLSQFPNGAILEEIQRAPELASYLQVLVDERDVPGQFIVTGSQNFLLMERFSQSLARRILLFRLLPFSLQELGRRIDGWSLDEMLLTGGYPRIHAQKIAPPLWMAGYVETYVQRDVRPLRNVGDLRSFDRFLRLCAGRTAGVLNVSSLASDAGISVNTAKAWLSVLEASFVIHLLPSHHENFRKRIVKAPKLHFIDTGLLCYLLGIHTKEQLSLHPKRGDIFESFVVGEFLKSKNHARPQWQLSYWRNKGGHELDVLVSRAEHRLPVEIKSGQTVASDWFRHLDYWQRISDNPSRGLLVYGGKTDQQRTNHDVLTWRSLEHIVARTDRQMA